MPLVPGSVCAERVPAFSSATREGFAVRAADIAAASIEQPVRLLVVDAVLPGHRPRLAVVPGAAVRVHLGSALPEGAEAVVVAESVAVAEDVITISAAVPAGAHIRRVAVDSPLGRVCCQLDRRLMPDEYRCLQQWGSDV